MSAERAATCVIPNSGERAPAGRAFCAHHADEPGAYTWQTCPSTHCERRGECASPNDCIVTERARDRLAGDRT